MSAQHNNRQYNLQIDLNRGLECNWARKRREEEECGRMLKRGLRLPNARQRNGTRLPNRLIGNAVVAREESAREQGRWGLLMSVNLFLVCFVV